MDLPEAARLLHVTDTTLERWVRQGLLTARAGGDTFDRAELERWARERGLPCGTTSARAPERTERLLSSAVGRGEVLRDVTAASAFEVIAAAVRAVPDLDEATRGDVLARVLARERLASTALGHGVALPHPRDPLAGVLADPIVVVVHLRRPVDWAALDGDPVHTALLLLSPSAPVHLQLLSRVSLVLRVAGTAEWLSHGRRRDALVERFREIEASSTR